MGDGPVSRQGTAQSRPESSGTGFFITEDGHFINNQHVAGEGATVRVLTASGLQPARVMKVDPANDLALRKVQGRFAALPVIPSRTVRLGATAATVGFPNTGLQGFAPKPARGRSPASPGRRMTRGISRSARPSTRGTPAARWWTSGATSSAW